MIKNILLVSLLFSSSSFSKDWTVDLPSSEQDKIVSSFVASFPMLDGSSSEALSSSLGVDISNRIMLSDFIGENLDLIKSSSLKSNICKLEGNRCINETITKSYSFKIPILGGVLWAPFYNKEKERRFIRLSSKKTIKLKDKMMILSLDENESYPIESFGMLKLFSGSLISKEIKEGNGPFKLCNTYIRSYLCSSDDSDYFLNMSHFINIIMYSCIKCTDYQKLYLEYLKYAHLMRVNNKDLITKSYPFFTKNSKNLINIGVDYKLERDIYLKNVL